MTKFFGVLAGACLATSAVSAAETNVLSDIAVDEMAQLNNTQMETIQGEAPPSISTIHVIAVLDYYTIDTDPFPDFNLADFLNYLQFHDQVLQDGQYDRLLPQGRR